MSAESHPAMDTDDEDGPIRPGLRMGNYQLESELGSGGFGTVFAARHIGLDKPVVVKALHPTLAMSERAVLRFVREGRAASRIRHPHVVDVTDVGTHRGIPFLVMEYLEGEDLESRLGTVKRLPCSEAAEIMLPVLDAVAMAHEQGVVHRDLKPSNIFLAHDHHGAEVPMVLDFGIAKILDSEGVDRMTLTRAASFVGTAYYASPEQAKSGKDADPFSDQYSLGAILFQLVSGTLPATGGTPFEVLSKIVAGESTKIASILPQLDPRMRTIIERAMAYERHDRYPSLREMGAPLLQLAEPDVAARWRSAFGGRIADASGRHPLPAAADANPSADPAVEALPATRPFAAVDAQVAAPALATATTADKRGGRGLYVAAVVALGVLVAASAAAGGLYFARQREVPVPEDVRVDAPPEPRLWEVTNPGAQVEIDGELIAARPVPIPSDGRAHRVRVTLAGHQPYETRIGAGQDELPPLTLTPIETATQTDVEPGTNTEAEQDAEPVAETETETEDETETETEPAAEATPRAAAHPHRDGRGRSNAWNARSGSRTGSTSPVDRGNWSSRTQGRSFSSRGRFGGSSSPPPQRRSGRNGALILH